MKVTGQNIILKGVSGKFGDQLVIRQRKGRIVIAALPKKSVKPPTSARRVKPNQSIYHAAISAFMVSEGK